MGRLHTVEVGEAREDVANTYEVCAVIAQATLTNYVNHVNDTQVDFPPVPDMSQHPY